MPITLLRAISPIIFSQIFSKWNLQKGFTLWTETRFDFPLPINLAEFCLCGRRLMANISGFRPLSGILIPQCTSNVVHTLVRWVVSDDSIFGQVCHISALVTEKWAKLVVSNHFQGHWSPNPHHAWYIHRWFVEDYSFFGHANQMSAFWYPNMF